MEGLLGHRQLAERGFLRWSQKRRATSSFFIENARVEVRLEKETGSGFATQ